MQIDYFAILDIIQQSLITSIFSIIKVNGYLVKALQFLQSFYLMVKHKLKKDHIVLDILSKLANSNVNLPAADLKNAKLDILFTYLAILLELHPDFFIKNTQKYNQNK